MFVHAVFMNGHGDSEGLLLGTQANNDKQGVLKKSRASKAGPLGVHPRACYLANAVLM